jgi:hypothetical protein
MYRDLLPEARKIDQWRAIIRSDRSDVCQTPLSIAKAETKRMITREIKTDLALGENDVALYSLGVSPKAPLELGVPSV